MEQKKHLLRELPAMTVCKTSKSKNPGIYYICLVPGKDNYTVFTSEQNGFVMSCTTKQIIVEILHKPENDNATLATYHYTNPLYETFRKKAITYLLKNQKKLEPQVLKIAFECEQEIQNEIFVAEAEETGFLEGKEKYRLHKYKERSSELVKNAKAKYLESNPKLECQACDFSFIENYGEIGKGFIEAHHIYPIKSLTEETETKIEDLVLVCSNCHRMLHRERPWVKSIEELKSLRTKQAIQPYSF